MFVFWKAILKARGGDYISLKRSQGKFREPLKFQGLVGQGSWKNGTSPFCGGIKVDANVAGRFEGFPLKNSALFGVGNFSWPLVGSNDVFLFGARNAHFPGANMLRLKEDVFRSSFSWLQWILGHGSHAVRIIQTNIQSIFLLEVEWWSNGDISISYNHGPPNWWR